MLQTEVIQVLHRCTVDKEKVGVLSYRFNKCWFNATHNPSIRCIAACCAACQLIKSDAHKIPTRNVWFCKDPNIQTINKAQTNPPGESA